MKEGTKLKILTKKTRNFKNKLHWISKFKNAITQIKNSMDLLRCRLDITKERIGEMVRRKHSEWSTEKLKKWDVHKRAYVRTLGEKWNICNWNPQRKGEKTGQKHYLKRQRLRNFGNWWRIYQITLKILCSINK